MSCLLAAKQHQLYRKEEETIRFEPGTLVQDNDTQLLAPPIANAVKNLRKFSLKSLVATSVVKFKKFVHFCWTSLG